MQPWNAADISEDEERPVTTVSDLTDSRLSALPGTVVAAARLEHTTHTASIIYSMHTYSLLLSCCYCQTGNYMPGHSDRSACS